VVKVEASLWALDGELTDAVTKWRVPSVGLSTSCFVSTGLSSAVGGKNCGEFNPTGRVSIFGLPVASENSEGSLWPLLGETAAAGAARRGPPDRDGRGEKTWRAPLSLLNDRFLEGVAAGREAVAGERFETQAARCGDREGCLLRCGEAERLGPLIALPTLVSNTGFLRILKGSGSGSSKANFAACSPSC